MKIEKIENCARCGGIHEMIELKELSNHKKYTHYSICPTNGQPILVKYDDHNGNIDVMIFSHEKPN